jgi:hypothetical protein
MMADSTQAVPTAQEVVKEAVPPKETTVETMNGAAEPVSVSAETKVHGAEAGGVGNRVVDKVVKKKTETAFLAAEPTAALTKEPATEKKQEIVTTAPKPSLPAAPATFSEASVPDPATPAPVTASTTENILPTTETKSAPAPTAEAPDPDEDELDDLDGMSLPVKEQRPQLT